MIKIDLKRMKKRAEKFLRDIIGQSCKKNLTGK